MLVYTNICRCVSIHEQIIVSVVQLSLSHVQDHKFLMEIRQKSFTKTISHLDVKKTVYEKTVLAFLFDKNETH